MAKNTFEAKRKDYREYLDKQGVLDTFTKALVSLHEHPDRPSDALRFLKASFCGDNALLVLKEVDEARAELEATKTQLKEYKDELEKHKADTETLLRELAYAREQQFKFQAEASAMLRK